MASNDSADFDVVGLLDALAGVELIVVGGVAAAIYGGPRLTLDLDIVPDASPGNVDDLADRLAELDAFVREPGSRRIPVTRELMLSTVATAEGGQLRLITRLGPLDVLWRLHDGRGYRALAGRSQVLSDDEREIRVIGIEDLIDVKTKAGRPQDLADVRYLKEIKSRRS